MRRTTITLLLLMAMASMLVWAVYAQSPHFIRTSASINSAGVVTVSFKEAGLGSNQNILYEASADYSACYACQNNGGNFPSDPKKQSSTGTISATGEFNSGKNGSVTASIPLGPPDSTLNCPGGQRRVLVSVSYSNLRITDLTNGVSQPIGGSFSSTPITSISCN